MVLALKSTSVQWFLKQRLAESDLVFKKTNLAAEWRLCQRALKGLEKDRLKGTHRGERWWSVDQSSHRVGGDK